MLAPPEWGQCLAILFPVRNSNILTIFSNIGHIVPETLHQLADVISESQSKDQNHGNDNQGGNYLRTAGSASRQELDGLLIPLLSDALTPEQKRNKVHNLLAKLRRQGTIANTGTRRDSRWELL